MIKFRHIFTAVILFLLVFLIWRTSILFTDLSYLFSNKETTTELSQNTSSDESTINLNKPSQLTANNIDHYETIEETIARLKRDVIVTGTITGTLEQESAMFQIEGMADRLFKINTQLMDGFIIKEITGSYVVLKNQAGNETFSLYVQSGGESLDNTELEAEFNTIPAVPDGDDKQQFPDEIQHTIEFSEHPENTDQAISTQNETGFLENTDLEQNSNTTPMTPDEYDSQQFLNEIKNSNYAADEPDEVTGMQLEEAD